MGAVNLPGTQQLQGQSSLFDVLASAGGLKADAGDIITIMLVRRTRDRLMFPAPSRTRPTDGSPDK